MTLDYKNVSESRAQSKKTNKKSGKTKSPKALSAWFMLFSGVVIGSFVSFLIYLSVGVDVEEGKLISTNEETVLEQPKPIVEKIEKLVEEVKRFEFYSILPEREIEVPVVEMVPEKEIVKIHQPPAIVREQTGRSEARRLYMLQVGSFSRFKDADKRKANLAFMGVTSKIHAISNSDRTMYRVQVGPFGNIGKVNEITSLLKQKKIPSLLMKVKG